jgi:hypothetical protein
MFLPFCRFLLSEACLYWWMKDDSESAVRCLWLVVVAECALSKTAHHRHSLYVLSWDVNMIRSLFSFGRCHFLKTKRSTTHAHSVPSSKMVLFHTDHWPFTTKIQNRWKVENSFWVKSKKHHNETITFALSFRFNFIKPCKNKVRKLNIYEKKACHKPKSNSWLVDFWHP